MRTTINTGASSLMNTDSFKPCSIKVRSIRLTISIAITIAFEISKSKSAKKFSIRPCSKKFNQGLPAKS